MNIEYENNLPKGYLHKRRQTTVLYLLTIYLYSLINILIKAEVISVSSNNTYLYIICPLLLLSCTALAYSFFSTRNYKGIQMYHYNEIKAFKRKEKFLYALPIVISCFLIPLNLLMYLFIVGPCYLSFVRFYNPSDAYDAIQHHDI